MRSVLIWARPDGVIRVTAPNGEHRRFLAVGHEPTVSPDGRYVAYAHERQVRVIPTASGKPTVVASAFEPTLT